VEKQNILFVGVMKWRETSWEGGFFCDGKMSRCGEEAKQEKRCAKWSDRREDLSVLLTINNEKSEGREVGTVFIRINPWGGRSFETVCLRVLLDELKKKIG